MGLRSVLDDLTAIEDGDWIVSTAERPGFIKTNQVVGLVFLVTMAVVLPLGPARFAVAATILAAAVFSGMLESRVPARNVDGVLQWVNSIASLICATLLPFLTPFTAIAIIASAAGISVYQGRRTYVIIAFSSAWLGTVAYFNDLAVWYLTPITLLGVSSGLVEFSDWFRTRTVLQRQRMELVSEVGGAFTWEHDMAADLLLQANGSTEALLGRTGPELIEFLNQQAESEPHLALAHIEGGVREIAHVDGSQRWFKLDRRFRQRADGSDVAFGVAVDVSEIELARRREQKKAEVDPLTGLANRNGLAQFLDAEADRVGRAMLVVDLDRFKDINDSLGHLVGDKLIAAAAQRLIKLGGDHRFIARLGGDEFAAAVVGDSADVVNDEADFLASEICRVLAVSFAFDEVELNTSGSVGIASGAGLDWTELLRRADGAMYEAKRGGHGHQWYDHDVDEGSVVRLQRRNRLNRTLEDELILYYQPVVSAEDHRMVSVEALARWDHPDEGILAPDTFLPLLEQAGLTVRFDRHVLRTAVGCAARLASVPGDPIVVSVNLSPRSLWSAQLVGELRQMLEENPMAQGRISIEVTEQGLSDEPDRLAPMLHSLSDLGIRLSLDDFGTGASSLIRLRSLPFDTIKIDRSFVAGILVDHADTVIVRSTIQLAHDLGKTTVAEGVETFEQANALAAMGCTYLQGWAFSHAVPLPELLEQQFPIAGSDLPTVSHSLQS